MPKLLVFDCNASHMSHFKNEIVFNYTLLIKHYFQNEMCNLCLVAICNSRKCTEIEIKNSREWIIKLLATLLLTGAEIC